MEGQKYSTCMDAMDIDGHQCTAGGTNEGGRSLLYHWYCTVPYRTLGTVQLTIREEMCESVVLLRAH